MKNSNYIPIIGMGFMLFFVQILSLILIKPFDMSQFRAFENPENTMNVFYWIVLILLFTGFMLFMIKTKKDWIIKPIILFTVAWILYYVFYSIFSMFLSENITILTLVFSIGLTFILYIFPEWYIIDSIGLLLGAGSAALFGVSLDIIPTIILLFLLAIYDFIAVYKTKHMISLAEGVLDLKLPVILVIPKNLNYSFINEKFDLNKKDAFFMGLGDTVMPTILVVSSNFFLKTKGIIFPIIGFVNIPTITTIIGTLIGFSLLMWFVMKGKPQAGLPLLNGGAIIGFFIGYIL